jgi:ferredoxin
MKKVMRKIVEIDDELCDGCGLCVPACAEGAMQIVDGKARIVAEKYCDGLGACLGECPNGALRIVQKEADDFDEEAVEFYLKEKKVHQAEIPLACGCPSTQVRMFKSSDSYTQEDAVSDAGSASGLSHWPVQIRLVPPTAPFLDGAHLLIAADCTPVAYPHFHRDFLKGKVVLLGCPKFDDIEGYIQKFADIFNQADIKRITVLTMEVPCCSTLPVLIRRAMDISGKNIPMEEVVIGTRGEIIKRL